MKIARDRLKELVAEEFVKLSEAQGVDPYDMPAQKSTGPGTDPMGMPSEEGGDEQWYRDQLNSLMTAHGALSDFIDREQNEAVDPDQDMLSEMKQAAQHIAGYIDALLPMVDERDFGG